MASERLIRLVPHDELATLCAAFLDDCTLANLAPKTLSFYRANLERFHSSPESDDHLRSSELVRGIDGGCTVRSFTDGSPEAAH